MILVLIFSIPAVQTSLGRKLTKRINEDFGTNINVGKVGLQFNGDVELKEIYIEDYRNDTLISIDELNTSILSFKNLYDGKLVFGDVDIEGLLLNIYNYKGETDTNLDIFVARFDEEKPKNSSSSFLLSSSDVSVYDSEFRLYDENKERPKKLHLNDLNINATNFLINGKDVSTRINTLSFLDSRGLQIEKLSTNFFYSPSRMTFDGLNIKTENSDLKGDLEFTYAREDLQFFEDKVNLVANFKDSKIALDDLNTFYSEFGKNQFANIEGDFTGTLNDLSARNLKVNTSRRTRINGNVVFKNLFSSAVGDFSMQGNFKRLSSNYNDLKALLPNVLGASIPSVFERLGNFTITGNTLVTASTVNADIEINTELGFIDSDLKMQKVNDIDNASYSGNVVFDEFNMGAFLNDPMLGLISLDLDVEGQGFDSETISTNLKGEIFTLNYNNYNYRNIDVLGLFENKVYNGKLIVNDNNLILGFDGLADLSKDINSFDFVANVDYANLNALNFVKKDSISIFKGIVDMKMKGTSVEDAVGDISFKKTNYKNQYDNYYFEDFAISSSFKNNKRYISVNSPDIVEGEMSGVFKFRDIKKIFENSLGHIYTNYIPHEIEDNQFIDFNFKIYNKIVEVFYSDLRIAKNSFIRGHIESDEKGFKLTFKSPKIELKDQFASNVELQLDNKNPLFNTYVEVDSIKSNYYNVSKFNLLNLTVNDTLFMRSEFRGGKKNSDVYNLSFYHTIDSAKRSVIGFKRSDVTFKNNTWHINEKRNPYNKLSFNKALTEFNFDRFVMSHKNEEIKLSGVIRDSTYKDLKLDFKNVRLSKIGPDIDSLKLNGIVNGKLDLLQKDGNYLPNSSIVVDNFKINDFNLGAFDAKIKGNNNLTNYDVDIKIKNDYGEHFSAVGDINVARTNATIDVDLKFDDFSLLPLNPLLSDVLRGIKGQVFGNAKVAGRLNSPDITGELILNQAGLGIIELDVDYDFKDNALVKLEEQSFIFKNLAFNDVKHRTRGTLNGRLNHVNLSNWSLDLRIDTPRLLVLDTKETEDALYYGTGYLGGVATIYGPSDELVIDVEGWTEEGTIFKIPLNDSESFGDNTFIHFITPEEKQARVNGESLAIETIKGLELDFDLDINRNAEIELVIDKDSGNSIKGRGEGGLLFDINTNGKFNMYGDIAVLEGVYNFYYGGLIQKVFTVEPGGYLRWEGDPLGASIDLTAVYSTRANPSPLLDNPINRSIPVNVQISLTGQLEQPQPDFNFQFPTVSSTVKSELEYRLESAEDRSNQALYLLTTGAFSSGLNDISVSGTLNERLNGILSELFATGDDSFKLGVNYEIGQDRPDYRTDDRVGVTLQTKLSDRVLINGKVGVPVGGATETVIAGDIQIDFLLNDEGTLTANVFNRENSIQNFGEEIGYTQGMGISYSVEFDTFKELIQKLFKKKNKEEEPEEENNTSTNQTQENSLPDFVKLKTASSTKN